MPNIAGRPAAVNERAELGHWEGDQIIGKSNRSSILWLTERVMRFAIPVTMPEGYAVTRCSPASSVTSSRSRLTFAVRSP